MSVHSTTKSYTTAKVSNRSEIFFNIFQSESLQIANFFSNQIDDTWLIVMGSDLQPRKSPKKYENVNWKYYVN